MDLSSSKENEDPTNKNILVDDDKMLEEAISDETKRYDNTYSRTYSGRLLSLLQHTPLTSSLSLSSSTIDAIQLFPIPSVNIPILEPKKYWMFNSTTDDIKTVLKPSIDVKSSDITPYIPSVIQDIELNEIISNKSIMSKAIEVVNNVIPSAIKNFSIRSDLENAPFTHHNIDQKSSSWKSGLVDDKYFHILDEKIANHVKELHVTGKQYKRRHVRSLTISSHRRVPYQRKHSATFIDTARMDSLRSAKGLRILNDSANVIIDSLKYNNKESSITYNKTEHSDEVAFDYNIDSDLDIEIQRPISEIDLSTNVSHVHERTEHSEINSDSENNNLEFNPRNTEKMDLDDHQLIDSAIVPHVENANVSLNKNDFIAVVPGLDKNTIQKHENMCSQFTNELIKLFDKLESNIFDVSDVSAVLKNARSLHDLPLGHGINKSLNGDVSNVLQHTLMSIENSFLQKIFKILGLFSSSIQDDMASEVRLLFDINKISKYGSDAQGSEWDNKFKDYLDSWNRNVCITDLLCLLMSNRISDCVDSTKKKDENLEDIQKNGSLITESLITSGISTIKTMFFHLFIPYIEYSIKNRENISEVDKYVQKVVNDNRKLITSIFYGVSNIMESFESLVEGRLVSEMGMINIIYLCINSFFIDYSKTFLNFERFKLISLKMCRTVSINHPKQRIFIIDEILSSLSNYHTKVQTKTCRTFRVHGSLTLNCVTVLLLQILQTAPSSKSTITSSFKFIDEINSYYKDLDSNEIKKPIVKKRGRAAKKAKDNEKENSQKLHEIINDYSSNLRKNLEESYRMSTYIFQTLISRASINTDTKKSKSSNDTSSAMEHENKAILSMIVKDLLLLIGNMEWPSADICLLSYVQIMTSYLSDQKPKADPAMKNMALEFLGDICCELVKLDKKHKSNPIENLPNFSLALKDNYMSTSNISVVWSLEKSILEYLSDLTLAYPIYNSGFMFLICSFFYYIPTEIDSPEDYDKIVGLLLNYSHLILTSNGFEYEKPDEAIRLPKIDVVKQLNLARPLYFDSNQALIDSISQRSNFVSKICMYVSSGMGLQQAFEPLFSKIASFVDSDVVTIRIKALKALHSIFKVNPSIEMWNKIKIIIELNIHNTSASVRDAALDVLGESLKCNILDDVKFEYYPVIGNRTLDVSLAVRKKALKLIKEILVGSDLVKSYSSNPKVQHMFLDLMEKVNTRLNDEENSIRNLALSIIKDIFFNMQKGVNYKCLEDSNDRIGINSMHLRDFISLNLESDSSIYDSISDIDKKDIMKLSILLFDFNFAISLGDITSNSLVRIIQCIQESNSKYERGQFLITLKVFVDAWIECLSSPSEAEKFDDKHLPIFSALHQISKTYPELLVAHINVMNYFIYRGDNIDTVSLQQKEEQNTIIMDIMANIIKRQGDIGPASMIDALESDLISILNVGTRQSVVTAAKCLGLTIKNITNNYSKIIILLDKCYQYIRRIVLVADKLNSLESIPEQGVKNAIRCLLIVSSILHQLKIETILEGVGKKDEDASMLIKSLPKSVNVIDYTMESIFLLLRIDLPSRSKSLLIFSLGEILLSSSKSLLNDNLISMMRDVFQKPQNELLKSTLLSLFFSFLQVEPNIEDEKRNIKLLDDYTESTAAIEKNPYYMKQKQSDKSDLDIEVLVGNAEELGETTISRSIVQMFLEEILVCLKDRNEELSGIAFDVVETIVEQGIVFPTMIIPSIIAIEASHNPLYRMKAYVIHKYFMDKHSSIFESCDLDCVLEMYKYCSLTRGFDDKPIAPYVTNKDGLPTEYPEVAVIDNIYTLMKSKKSHKIRFLRGMAKMLDFLDPESEGKYASVVSNFSESQGKVQIRNMSFMKFLCEQLLLLTYKNEDEVLIILSAICEVLAISGIQVIRVLNDLVYDTKLTSLSDDREAIIFIKNFEESIKTEIIEEIFNPTSLDRNDDTLYLEEPAATISSKSKSFTKREKSKNKINIKETKADNDTTRYDENPRGLRRSRRNQQNRNKREVNEEEDGGETDDTNEITDGEFKSDSDSESSLPESSSADDFESEEEEQPSEEDSSYCVPLKRKQAKTKKGQYKFSESTLPSSSVLHGLLKTELSQSYEPNAISSSFKSSDNDESSNRIIMKNLKSCTLAVLLLSKLRISLQSLYGISSEKILQFSDNFHSSDKKSGAGFDKLAIRKIRKTGHFKEPKANPDSIMWDFSSEFSRYLLNDV